MQQTLPHLIVETIELQKWADKLQAATWVAIDTESDSLHHYKEKVCLIQMTALGEDVLIDPLALPSLDVLRPVLKNPAVTKIFHDAGYDLICLRRDFNFEVNGLFDTMLASRLLGERQFGLGAILSTRFNFVADKRQQRSDWSHRPLSAAQLHYARYDTHFLTDLALQLTSELRAVGRLQWAQEDFARLPKLAEKLGARARGHDGEGFWRVQGAKNLDASAKGRLRALYEARERIAVRLDRPTFKVFGDELLVAMASNPPVHLQDFRMNREGRRHGAARFAREMLAALERAEAIFEEPPKNSGRRRRTGRLLDPAAKERYEALRAQRRNSADALGLEPEVLLSNAILEQLARAPATTADPFLEHEEFSGWREPFILSPMRAALSRAHARTYAAQKEIDGPEGLAAVPEEAQN